MTPSVGDVVAGKYRIDDVLGRGGMGLVFSATNQATNKRVALKWMLPGLVEREDALERFVREARNAGSIDDPHVVNVFDVGEDGGTAFLVMELLRGEPLSRLMKRPDIGLSELIEVLVGASRGVAAAHAKNIIHRDLKPDNIFVCEYPGVPRSAKVLDFGISKLVDPAFTSVSGGLTADGTALGTPYYMSPEQARGQHDIDHRADIYSFGVILFEVATGRVPFDAAVYNALLLKILNEEPPTPRSIRPELPAALEAVILRAIARNREDRFQRISDLGDALKGLVVEQALDRTLSREWHPETLRSTRPTTGGAVVTTGSNSTPRNRRNRLLAAMGALAVVVAGALGLLRLRTEDAGAAAGAASSESGVGIAAERPTQAAPFVGVSEPTPADPMLPIPSPPATASTPTVAVVGTDAGVPVATVRPSPAERARPSAIAQPKDRAPKPRDARPSAKPRSGAVRADEF